MQETEIETSTHKMSLRVAEPAKVSRQALTAVLWTGVAVSFCCVAFRGYVRLRVFHRFFLDDILVFSAWLIFLANVILYQIMLPTLYLMTELYDLPEDFPAKFDFFLHAYMAASFAFWCCLWSIKASFLVFFRKLGHKVARQNFLWWCALSITVIGFIMNFAIWYYKCSVGYISVSSECGLSASSIHDEDKIFRTTSAFDIVSDCFILILPINILWKVQIKLQQRLLLGLVLSLTVCVIITAIVRVTFVLAQSKQLDLTWIFTWGVVEEMVAIMVACLMSYRALFIKDSGAQRLPNLENHTSQQQLRYDQYGEVITIEQSPLQNRQASDVGDGDASEHFAV